MGYPVVQPKLLNYNTGYGWYYVMGYRFTALSAVTIDQLGGYFYGTKTVKLLNASYQVIASASITSANAWVYVGITPVQLVANQVYYVVVDVGGSGGAYGTVSSVPTTTSDIRIDYGAYQSGSAFDGGHTNAGTAVYGLVDVGISTQTDWTKSVSDSLSLSEAVGFGRNAHEADQLALADQVRALIVDHGWGVEAWSEARWGVVLRKQSADDSIGLADALARRPRPRATETALGLADGMRKQSRLVKADALGLADALRAAVEALRNDVTGLSDDISPRSLVLFADVVGLADSLLLLDRAMSGDAVDMPDLIQSLVRLQPGDQVAVSDISRAKAKPRLSDVAAVADMITAAVAAYRADQVSLADEIAAGTGLLRDDVLGLLDGIASAAARGAEDEALELADELVNRVILAINDYAGSPNRCAGVANWTLSGGAYVDADGIVHLPAYGAEARCPLAPLGRADWTFSAEFYSEEPRPGYTDMGGFLLSSTYFNINGQAAYNSSNYTGNGNAQTYPVGTWTRKYWTAAGGNNVAFMRMAVRSNATYTAPEFLFRRPMVTVDGSWQDYVPSGVLDGLAVAIGASAGEDSAGWADQLARRMGKSVADLLATLDSIRSAAGGSLTDVGGAADGLSLTIRRTLGDLLGLVDGIRADLRSCRPIPALWGQGLWSSSLFGGAHGDPLGVADQVSIARGAAMLAQDVLAMADELRARARLDSADQVPAIDSASARPRARTGDMVPTADGFATQARPSIFDLLSVVDALLRAVAGVMSGDALLSTDSLVQLAVGVLAGDLLSASDDSQLAVARLLSDLLALGDSALRRVGRAITDATALVDTIHSRTGLLLLDDAALAEALTCLVAIGVQDDSTAFLDAIMAAVTVRHGMTDGVDLLDALRLAAAAALVDMLALPDQVTAQTSTRAADSVALLDAVISAATPRVAELLGLSDAQLQALVRAVQAGGLNLAEQLAAHTGSSSAEAQPVADALVAALRMARQAEDLLASIDTVRAAVVKLLPDDIGLSDQMMLGIRAARAEAASVADLLGLSSGKQLPEDMVGVIDENWLRAAVGLEPDRFGVLDRVRGRVLRVLQQVFIQGVQVPVSGLRVHHSASERVGTCSFSIPNPSPEVLALARQRAEVRVYLLDGDGTDFFAGRIVGNPVRARGTITTELQITVDDWTAASQDVFVQEVYTADSGTVDQIVRHMWAKYFGRQIRLEVTPTGRCLDLYRINYDSLFDATEQLAQLLGWVWFVDWDGADLVLRFFPPSSAVSAVTLSRVNRNVVANTARFGQDEQIKNSIYVFGGDGRSAPYTERLVADGQKAAYRLAYKPYRPPGEESGVIVLVGGVQQSVGIVGLHNAADYDVLLDFQQQQLAWREDNRPGSGTVIEARYSYAYPILVHLTDDQSVERFGLSESVVTDSKILDVRTAREVGRAQLRKSAWPRGYGSCEVLVSGLRAGQFVTVDMPAYGASGLYEILEVEKWIEGATVRRRVALNVADSPEARIAERLKEFARRLSSLESTQRTDDISVQRILRDPANLALSVVGAAAGHIYDQEQDSAEISEVTAVTWKTAGAAKVQVASQRLVLRDGSSAAMGPKNNSISQVREYVRGGISFFGQAKWGEKPWGVSAS